MTSSGCSHGAQILRKVPGPLWVDMEDGLVIARAPRRWRARATSRILEKRPAGTYMLLLHALF